jgi:hypothetical protein
VGEITALDKGGGATSLTQPSAAEAQGSLLGDLLAVYFHPATLFARLPRWNRATQALLVLLVIHILYAVAVISTAVFDYEIDARTQHEIGKFADPPPTDDSRDKQNLLLDALEKGAVFAKLLTRVLLLVNGPLQVFLGVGTLASVLFVVVALWGGAKPDFQLLAGVAIFAAFVEVPRLLLRLFLLSQLQVSRVETSAAALLPGPHIDFGTFLLLRRLDPFDIWYWCLVGLGVWKTGQLSGRFTVVVVLLLALVTVLLQVGADVSIFADIKIETQ